MLKSRSHPPRAAVVAAAIASAYVGVLMRLSCGAWEIALLHPADARVAGGRLLLVLHLLTMVAGLVTLLRELAPTPEGNTLAAVVARASVTGGRL